MRLNQVVFYFIFLLAALISCKSPEIPPPDDKIDEEEPKKEDPKFAYWEEDNWIYEQMTRYYLWAEDMPHEDSTDKNLEPEKYFYSLIDKERDKYSYFKADYNEIFDYWSGHLESYGFRYTKIKIDSSLIKLAVSLVLKGSPAEQAGLERGHIINKINGQYISPKNVESLLKAKDAVFNIIDENGELLDIHMMKKRFQLNPNHHYSIIETPDKKIGYWVYLQFLDEFREETREIFKYFKENDIDEIIVDFRFNPGGVTPNAEVVATLLGPDLSTNTLLYGGNPAPTHVNEGRYFTSEIYNLSKLSRVFFLTSGSTASSSELVINCLQPYRPVYTVGSPTYGKNIISIILWDEEFDFGIMPAWGKIFNANGVRSPVTGIIPEYTLPDNMLPYRPLGDTAETLLNGALRLIDEKFEKTEGIKIELTDSFHYFDTGSGFIGNERYY